MRTPYKGRTHKHIYPRFHVRKQVNVYEVRINNKYIGVRESIDQAIQLRDKLSLR